jgi:SAM-dependent methyltransferase
MDTMLEAAVQPHAIRPEAGTRPDAHQRAMLRLFGLSVLKQRKWRQIAGLLGPTEGLTGLDIGADNGVISYLLRRQGGAWTSADLDARTVEAIRAMVGASVVRIQGAVLPFPDASFDRVALIDCVEHLHDDAAFLREVGRVLRPGGEAVVNVPFKKESWLRRFRLAIGQTDEAHGHVRHGYTPDELERLLAPRLQLVHHRTYSKFFSEAIDTAMTWAIRRLQRAGDSARDEVKGTVVTGADLSRHGTWLAVYAALYPLVWMMAQLDRLLWFRSGYMLIAKVRRTGAAA